MKEGGVKGRSEIPHLYPPKKERNLGIHVTVAMCQSSYHNECQKKANYRVTNLLGFRQPV